MDPIVFETMMGFLEKLKKSGYSLLDRQRLFVFLNTNFVGVEKKIQLSRIEFVRFDRAINELNQIIKIHKFLPDTDDVPREKIVELFVNLFDVANSSKPELSSGDMASILEVSKDLKEGDLVGGKLSRGVSQGSSMNFGFTPISLASNSPTPSVAFSASTRFVNPNVAKKEGDSVEGKLSRGASQGSSITLGSTPFSGVSNPHTPLDASDASKNDKVSLFAGSISLVDPYLENLDSIQKAQSEPKETDASLEAGNWFSVEHFRWQREIMSLGVTDEAENPGLFKAAKIMQYPVQSIYLAVKFIELLYPKDGPHVSKIKTLLDNLSRANITAQQAFEEIKNAQKGIGYGRLDAALKEIEKAVEKNETITLEYIRSAMGLSGIRPTKK